MTISKPVSIFLATILALALLAGCTTGGPTLGPTFTPLATADTAPPEVVSTYTPAVETPTPQALAPADATVIPEIPTPVLPYTTATLQSLSHTCLRAADYEPVVNRYLIQARQANLKDLWAEFDEQYNQIYGLMSSLTDTTNTFAHATTYSKMLLVGEYPIAINRPGVVGYVHCAVLVYMGGDEPEVGVGITDATLNETWSGYAYGLVRSEQEMRQYIHDRIGKAVIVRYQVSQDPRDASFVRSGFYSPVMKLLWENSYYTRFSRNPDLLKDNVGQPRGPGIRELMVLITSWPDEDIGIFLDYIIDPIL
jgi:hypothetical protein